MTGLEIVEAYFETDEMALRVSEGSKRDCMVIARKPMESDPAVERRRMLLTQPFREADIQVQPTPVREGPCIADYRKTAPTSPHLRARLAQMISPIGPVQLFRDVS